MRLFQFLAHLRLQQSPISSAEEEDFFESLESIQDSPLPALGNLQNVSIVSRTRKLLTEDTHLQNLRLAYVSVSEYTVSTHHAGLARSAYKDS